MDNFELLSFPDPVKRALRDLEFQKPTPIQAKAIPIALSRKDLIGCAQTGTGITAAFCLPILLRLMESPGKIALILAPTRELAQQIEVFWRQLTRFTPGVHSVCLTGGVPIYAQLQRLSRHPRLLIATPGRLTDHLHRKTVNLSKTEILVLDEADRMLDMGFAPQIAQILRFVPSERQTLFFSATWPREVEQLSKRYLREPVRVTVGNFSQPISAIQQTTIRTTSPQKREALLKELNQRQGAILVFARTKARTDQLARYLSSSGIGVNWIHGGRTQGQRNSALSGFRSGKARVLVATDIAARGIDVADIAHVINYDLPQSADDYIHRIGRTGRAGACGNAISFVTPEDRRQWDLISRVLNRNRSN
ncbi:MAG: DEAD/DEAH box helicase [Deltaproteobacteria bacterium]|nr:DEAD/DEAH box helicase [Deltaproteobacteria bacterium]